MCGRFPLAHSAQQHRSSVAPQLPHRRRPRQTRGSDTYHPSHNVAPNSYVPVIRRVLPEEDVSSLQVEAADEEEGEDLAASAPVIMQTMRWGLLPPHQKQLPTFKDTMNTINARDDTLLSGSPLWSRPFNKGQRCIVFVQGFYEWLKITKGSGVERIPHFIGMLEEGLGRQDRDGKEKKMMPLAGLWEKCRPDGESEERFTFTIITTDVSDKLNFLHDRQPLILPSEEAIATWMNPAAALIEVKKLVKTFEGALQFYKVPKEVGKVGNDNASFLLPVEDRKDGLMAAFGRAKKFATSDAKEEEEGKQNVPVPDTNSETNAPAPQEDDVSQNGGYDGAFSETVKCEVKDDALIEAAKLEERMKRDSPVPSVRRDHQGKCDPEPKDAEPSSRWSPDPWNPPVSPPRPNGGYSTTSEPHGGLSKYATVKKESGSHNDGFSPTKRKGGPDIKMGEGALENSFKKQKIKKETEEEMGIALEPRGGARVSHTGSTGSASAPPASTPPTASGTAATSPVQDSPLTSPKAKQRGPTPTQLGSPSRRGQLSPVQKSKERQRDLRNFFASP